MTSEKRDGYVSHWHPWRDSHKRRHTLTLLQDFQELFSTMSLDEIVQFVALSEQYCFIHDAMDEHELPYQEQMISHEHVMPYISRTGKIVALSAKRKRKSGFFIPASVWGKMGMPDRELLHDIEYIFDMFKYEALTPSSLSEKVLRGTLPDKLYIWRPSDMLRRTLLEYPHGGRIDERKEPARRMLAYSYDETKSYLDKSQRVPSPYKRPIYVYYGEGEMSEEWEMYETYWIECRMIAHTSIPLHPIHILDNGIMREPFQNEEIHVWLWKDELENCLEAGYTLLHVERAYFFEEMSDFMARWADILWESLDKCENEHQKDILKKMMVGLIGRFQKEPMKYELIHKDQTDVVHSDEPILHAYTKEGKHISPWHIRATSDVQSAQLTPQGHYIVMKTRSKMYRIMKREIEAGNELLGSYIDCYTVSHKSQLGLVGKERGQFKEKIHENVVVVHNQLIPFDSEKMRAPGFKEGSDARVHLWEEYHAENKNNKIDAFSGEDEAKGSDGVREASDYRDSYTAASTTGMGE